MLKEALHYKKLKNKFVQCVLCPNFCNLNDNDLGKCKVRKNIKGVLYSLSYGQPVAVHVDPIEKKPLYHFFPGSNSYSVGMPGCNLKCSHCQNWSISQKGSQEFVSKSVEAKDIVSNALNSKSSSISYSYTEPLVSYEYVLEISKLARKKGLKNVLVSNGFINKAPLSEISKYIDAANIDLKAFDDSFYKKVCKGTLKPVLDSLVLLKKKKVWLEITTLIIPGYNDKMKSISNMCVWIKKNLGSDVPLHFSRFFPCYNLDNLRPTPSETLVKAYQVAKNSGLRFVYLGNVNPGSGYSDTSCPSCGELLVRRGALFYLEENKLKNGKCFRCGEIIKGVWK